MFGLLAVEVRELQHPEALHGEQHAEENGCACHANQLIKNYDRPTEAIVLLPCNLMDGKLDLRSAGLGARTGELQYWQRYSRFLQFCSFAK